MGVPLLLAIIVVVVAAVSAKAVKNHRKVAGFTFPPHTTYNSMRKER
jgi:hypothetical protein